VIPEKEAEKPRTCRARLEAISAYGSVLYSPSVSGLLDAEKALLRFPKVSGWQQDPALTSLPNGQQFAQRWRAGTDAHDEEDYGADRASGDEVAQPHAHDRASGDGDRADQPQQGAASAEKVAARLSKAVDRDTEGRQPSEALPGGDRQRCEAH